MIISERIKEKGLKKKWLAKKLLISPTALSFYLSGERPMPEHIETKLKEMLQ